MRLDPEDASRQVVDTRLSVVRLDGEAPEIVQTLELGRQPSGVEINAEGTRALVANRADGTVSLLELTGEGRPVRLLGTFSVAEPEESVSHATFSPDGTRALVTLNKSDGILYVSLEDDTVTVLQRVDGRSGPYAAEFMPDGGQAVVGNVYDGTLSVLDVKADRIEIVDTIPVGTLAEGVDISPDGRWLAVNCLDNSNQRPEDPFYRSSGMVMLLRREGRTFSAVDVVRVGGIPQAAIFTPDGRYLAVASNTERDICFYELSKEGKLVPTGLRIPCSGGPAAMRIAN
nr:beta-propeller fold lactonase family protein [Ruficoccus amylovorans]